MTLFAVKERKAKLIASIRPSSKQDVMVKDKFLFLIDLT